MNHGWIGDEGRPAAPDGEPEDDGHEMDVVDSVLRQEEGSDSKWNPKQWLVMI